MNIIKVFMFILIGMLLYHSIVNLMLKKMSLVFRLG